MTDPFFTDWMAPHQLVDTAKTNGQKPTQHRVVFAEKGLAEMCCDVASSYFLFKHKA